MPSWYDIKGLGTSAKPEDFEATHGLSEIKSNSERIRKVMEVELNLILYLWEAFLHYQAIYSP